MYIIVLRLHNGQSIIHIVPTHFPFSRQHGTIVWYSIIKEK